MTDEADLTVTLEMPDFFNKAVLALATCRARLTATQIVVTACLSIELMTERRFSMGGLPLRFDRRNGSRIPRDAFRHTWRLSRVSFDAIAKGTA